ncbi:hypothetical protein [Polyangium mundeleinium]|uniref:Uncharacterized protein n=1 Tax=Polyangium mundeleinium TaxID=2995306 RepID=A0ABT5ELZ5_9BACT|nr:hypothetical protein [Polyangium mundeleinium]MDC0742816.1 hypothetical protein [Polyangium mundeleinium]
MGHQSTIYMTPKDTADLEQRLRERTDLAILLWKSPSASPRIVDSLNFYENGEQWYGLYLARPEDLDAIVMDYVKTQGYWTLESDPSPVVEFSCCSFKGDRLREGRVYYVDKFWTPDRGGGEERGVPEVGQRPPAGSLSPGSGRPVDGAQALLASSVVPGLPTHRAVSVSNDLRMSTGSRYA